MINKVLFTGRLAQEPEERFTQGDNPMSVTRFSLAIDKLDKEHTAGFVNIVAFGRLGEFAAKYFKKGMKIEFEGHVSPGSYTNKDGVKIYTVDFVAEKLGFAESKSSQNNNSGESKNDAKEPEAVPESYLDGFLNIPEGIDEELPFN